MFDAEYTDGKHALLNQMKNIVVRRKLFVIRSRCDVISHIKKA
jgi:hypothetical protein